MDIDFNCFANKNILITGATGLIGRALVKKLLSINSVTVIAAVRDEAKARKIFSSVSTDRLLYCVGDVCDINVKDYKLDYIVHCASMTASKDFINKPIDVIDCTVTGTRNILELAKNNSVKGVVFLSTMEVYGAPTTDEKIAESAPTTLNTMDVRSSYPESKRLAENLCAAYHAQYGVPVNVVRLTQTFGEGVDYNDGRVFAEFARCAIEGRDIVLKTKGETCRNYLYIGDAVNAILTVLACGARGEAYNAANDETYCSIFDMAQLVAENFGNGKTRVRIEESDAARYGYAPTLKMNLSSEKLRALGWKATADLKYMYAVMIDSMKNHSLMSK